MNNFINLTLECVADRDRLPEDLKEVIGVSTEWRPCLINISTIRTMYPDIEGTNTIIEFTDWEGTYKVKETFNEVREIIEANAIILSL